MSSSVCLNDLAVNDLPELKNEVVYPLKNKRLKISTVFSFDCETDGQGNLVSMQINKYNKFGYEEKFVVMNFFKAFIDTLLSNSTYRSINVVGAHFLQFDLSELLRLISEELEIPIPVLINMENVFPLHYKGNSYILKFKTIFTSSGSCYAIFKFYNENKAKGKMELVKTFHLIDTYLLFNRRLKDLDFEAEKSKLSRLFDSTKKLPAPDYLGHRKPKDKKEWEELEDYAMQDIRVSICLTERVVRFCKKSDIDISFLVSPASLSAKIFRTKYLTKVLKRNLEELEYAFDSYYGAKAECFVRGYFEDVNVYDINSSYPFSMTKPLPFNFNCFPYEYVEEFVPNKFGFYEVQLDIPDYWNYPSVAKRIDMKSSRYLVFPVGTVKTFINNDDLLYALNHGCRILDIKGWVHDIDETDINHPLKSFVEHYYYERITFKKQMKLTIDKLEHDRENANLLAEKRRYASTIDLLKLILNSLYGKFGSVNDEKQIEFKDEILIDCGTKITSGSLFCPRIASFITSYSRISLNKLLDKYNPLLCHTDSIYTQSKLPDKLVDDYELGKLKFEYNGNLMVLRASNYSLQYMEKGKEKYKTACHGFVFGNDKSKKAKINKKDIFGKWLFYGNTSSIKYLRETLIKIRGGYARNLPLHLLQREFRTHNAIVDTKRYYPIVYENMKDIRENPIQTYAFNEELLNQVLQPKKNLVIA